MAALSAGSITYSLQNQRRLGNSKVMNRVKVTLAAAQTYPTGGVLIGIGLTAATGIVGCPNAIESFLIGDEGTSGYNFNYNTSTGKIQLFVSITNGAGPAVELASSVTPGALVIYCEVIGW